MTNDIAEKLGVELDALQSAFEGFKVIPANDFDQMKSNFQSELEGAKDKYQAEGRTTGQELLLKELKNKFDLDYVGRRSTDNFVNAINEKFANAGSEEFGSKLTEVTKKYEAIEKEFEGYKTQIKEESDNRFINSTLSKTLAEYEGKTTLKGEDLLTLYTSRNTVKKGESGLLIYQGNEIVKNETMQPLSVEDSIKNFVEGGYLKPTGAKGGKGLGDESPVGKMSFERFEQSLVDQGYNRGSQEFNEQVNQATSNGTVEM